MEKEKQKQIPCGNDKHRPGSDLLHPLHIANSLDPAEFVDEAVEVADIYRFDDEVDDGTAIWSGIRRRGPDVGPVVRNYGRELLQQPGAVIAEDGQLYRVGLDFDTALLGVARQRSPLDLNAPVGLVQQVLNVWTA